MSSRSTILDLTIVERNLKKETDVNRHKNPKLGAARAALVLAAAFCLALAPAVQAQEVAQVRPGSSGIDFLPVVENGGFVLTVSGPEGFHHRAEFGRGESPSFSIFDEGGGVLPDGSYHYELWVVPNDAQRRDAFEANQVQSKSGGVEARVQSGGFSVVGGTIVAGGAEEPGPGGPVLAQKTIFHTGDGSIIGSLCVGVDCTNSESFGFDTLRLKENNLRIDFTDTSVGSFPTRDWEIEANDSANGGTEWLRVEDSDAGTSPFTLEGPAQNNSLWVDSSGNVGGNVGLGTSTPVVDLHVVSGNTPTMRLEQNNSSGFAAQTYDVAANETNFFIRDVTTGSKLPFRLRPGAPTSSIDVAANGNVGIGTSSPQDKLHVENTAGDDEDDFLVTTNGQLTIGSTNAGGLPTLMKLTNPNAATGGGAVRFVLENASSDQWSFTNDNVGAGELEINYIPNAGTEVSIDGSGNVTATSFNPTSSRSLKHELVPVEPKEVLTRLAELPISTWSFIRDDGGSRHLGPMAEDFKAAFGLGQSDKTINLTDASGVAFAAIQGLQELVAEKAARIQILEERLAALEQLLAEDEVE